MNYFCCDELRRDRLEQSALNGIDYLEVLDRDAGSEAERQRTLFVHFVNPLAIALSAVNVRLEGGERITGVAVTGVAPTGDARVLAVTVDRPGDFSTYTLRLVRSGRDDAPPAGIDRLFAAVEFSFKAECPSEFDCRDVRVCPPLVRESPEIDYLAKDYATLRRLMVDRLAALVPQWQERHAADVGVTLVELLAYVADQLSYRQDAVATEAYLGTARRRVSVRRHARLVDYFMHDGGNARAWLQVTVAGAQVLLAAGTTVLSRLAAQPRRLPPDQLPAILKKQAPVVFETMADALLFAAHNDLRFYTWGNERCCLPRGATRATLRDPAAARLRLRPGDVLILEEQLGPNTGLAADADPGRRHAVRLTRVVPEAQSERDAQGRESGRVPGPLVTDPLAPEGDGVVEIEWGAEDALPCPFCLSSVTDVDHGATRCGDVSIVHGNMVAADHGRTIRDEPLGTVPPPVRYRTVAGSADRCAPREREPVHARFRPTIDQPPLTSAAPLDPAAPATAAMRWDSDDLVPVIRLEGTVDGSRVGWAPCRDLLDRDGDAATFVVETEHDGTPSLRFGDGAHGLRPAPGTVFTATYRTGNGTAGNVGPDALWHILSADTGVVAVRNPLPSRGGLEPETVEAVRQRAPAAFRTQQRAVTAADYAAVAQRDPRVQRATASLRWTGSWHTVFVSVDPLGAQTIEPALAESLVAGIEPFRMAGHDLEVDGPVYVALELEMHVCVRPDTFRADVRQVLDDLFSNRVQPDGRIGLFHPDNFTFGQTVYLSRLYAAAQAVEGVASVHIGTFRRRGSVDSSAVDTGLLRLGRTEIAQLDNDRNFPERGVFRLTLGGGK